MHVTESLVRRVDTIPLKGFHTRIVTERELAEFLMHRNGDLHYENKDTENGRLARSSIMYHDGTAQVRIVAGNQPARWFLLGHEIGHFWLHPHLELFDIANYRREGHYYPHLPRKLRKDMVLEDEANYLAICTFIPLTELLSLYRSNELSPMRLIKETMIKLKFKSFSISTVQMLTKRMIGVMESLKIRIDNRLLYIPDYEYKSIPNWDDVYPYWSKIEE